MKKKLFIIFLITAVGVGLTLWLTVFQKKEDWIKVPQKAISWHYVKVSESDIEQIADFPFGLDLEEYDATRIDSLGDFADNVLVLRAQVDINSVEDWKQMYLSLWPKCEIGLFVNGKKLNVHQYTDIYPDVSRLGTPVIRNAFLDKQLSVSEDLLSALQNGNNEFIIVLKKIENGTILKLKDLNFYHSWYSRSQLPTRPAFKELDALFQNGVLPVVNINTSEATIPDEPKIAATLEVGNTEYPIGIEVRGRTSKLFDKQSYNLKIKGKKDSSNVNLLGLPADNRWVLYGPFADRSLMRNALSYSIMRDIGGTASEHRFVELVMNENYRGIYLLVQSLSIDMQSKTKEATEDSINRSIDVLIESVDSGWTTNFPPAKDWMYKQLNFELKSPRELSPQEDSLAKVAMNILEQELYKVDQELPQHIKGESFVDYFIFSEFTKNPDAYLTSTFIRCNDIEQPTFEMGPVWDYNMAYGQNKREEVYKPEGWIYNTQKKYVFWWQKLMANPKFQEAVVNRYAVLRKGALSEDHITSRIDSMQQYLGSAAERNFKRWPIIGEEDFWENHYTGLTYSEEVNYLKNWIHERLTWMDSQWTPIENPEIIEEMKDQ